MTNSINLTDLEFLAVLSGWLVTLFCFSYFWVVIAPLVPELLHDLWNRFICDTKQVTDWEDNRD